MNMRDFWAKEAAAMRDTSHLGIGNLAKQLLSDNQINEGGRDYAKESSKQFIQKFTTARKWTKQNPSKEAGYHIYLNPNNQLEITEMITSKSIGTISSDEHIAAMIKMDKQNKTIANKYRFIGRYHTHPLNDQGLGEDNPISPGDIAGLLSIARNGSINGNTDLQGYFEMVDSGVQRYTATIIDAELAKESAKNHNSQKWLNDEYVPTEKAIKLASPNLHIRLVIYNTLIRLVENKGICIESTKL
jgi:hypothetical protein